MKTRHSYPALLTLFFFVRALAVADLSVSPKAPAEINGVVVDWQDARIVNASVVIEGNNFRSATASNEIGEFRMVLPVGTYKITVTRPTFKTYVIKKLRVLQSNNAVLKITMKVKSATSGGKCPKGHICL